MSLNWDITKCDPAAKADLNWPTTDAFIWMTLAVDMGDLTAANEKEWRVRVAMWAQCELTKSTKSAFEYLLARYPSEWKMRHGLHCNVRTTTRAAFKRRLADYVEREAMARVAAVKEAPRGR